jgi:hypothetical protein
MQLKIETVEIGGREFFVRLTGKNNPPLPGQLSGSLGSRGVTIGEFPRQGPFGYATVQCPEKRCLIRNGARTEWVTVGP